MSSTFQLQIGTVNSKVTTIIVILRCKIIRAMNRINVVQMQKFATNLVFFSRLFVVDYLLSLMGKNDN